MLVDSDFLTLTEDRWKVPAPKVLSTNQLSLPSGKIIAQLDFQDPGILCTESKETGLDLFFRPDDDLQKVVRPETIVPLELSGSGSFAYIGNKPRIYEFKSSRDQEEFIFPFGALHLDIVVPHVGGSPSYRMKIFHPFLWAEVDLAEAIFALTRFHVPDGSAAADLLDETTFKAYSELNLSPEYRQRFTFWREVDRSISETISRTDRLSE